MGVEQVYPMVSVVVVMEYSVEPMNSESSVSDLVWTFAEHYGRVSADSILEETTASLVSVVVVVLARLVPVAWEERV